MLSASVKCTTGAPAIESFPLVDDDEDGDDEDDGDEDDPAKTEDANASTRAHSITVIEVFAWNVIFMVAAPPGREERGTGKPAQPTIDSRSRQN